MMHRSEIYEILLQNKHILPAWLISELDFFCSKNSKINVDIEIKNVTNSYLDFLLKKSSNSDIDEARLTDFSSRYKALSNYANKRVVYIMIFNSAHNSSLILDNDTKTIIYFMNNW